MHIYQRVHVYACGVLLTGLGGLFSAAGASSPVVEFTSLGRKQALESSWSKQLNALVGGWFSSWQHGQKGLMVGHARDADALRSTLHEAYYYGRILSGLLEQPQAEPVHIAVVQDRSIWRTRLQGAMPHGGVQSFYAEGTIFLYRSVKIDDPRDLADLPHEMVHAWVDASGETWPLWLEEGLALSWGETLAQKYYTLQNRYVKALEPQQENRPLDPTVFTHYPRDPEKALRFYRSSKALVRAIEELLDEAPFRTFLSEMSRPGAAWDQVLKEHCGVSDRKIESMKKLLTDKLQRKDAVYGQE